MQIAPVDELIDVAVRRTGLGRPQVHAALAGALGLLDRHADPERMRALYAAAPGAEDLAGSPEGRPRPGGGLLGGLIRSAGGLSGAAMADAMGLLSRLRKQGVDKADLRRLLPIAEEWVRSRSGRDLLGDALASVPGVGPLLQGKPGSSGA
ncbi:MAG: hypothetical protein K1X35_06415 [Caulobacteraceae bacterium]|nr:hypothetical protein [Caulobacteraceae bacterium]